MGVTRREGEPPQGVGDESRASVLRRALPINGVHLLVLSAFALAQPLFGLLRNNPEFFAIRGSRAVDIIVFAVILLFAPPLVMLAVEGLAGLIDLRLLRVVHLVFVALLVAVIALPLLKKTGSGSSLLLIPLALALGALAALGYARARGIRSFVTVLS